jgi:hypothetical protein
MQHPFGDVRLPEKTKVSLGLVETVTKPFPGYVGKKR